MNLREIRFLASKNPRTSHRSRGPSSLITVGWTRDKQCHFALCKLSLEEAEIHFVYFWNNMLRIIAKLLGSIWASRKIKKGKKHGTFSYRDNLAKMENNKGRWSMISTCPELFTLALQCGKLNFQREFPTMHYDFCWKVHRLHYNFYSKTGFSIRVLHIII